jgi:hypothetical protein
VDVTDVSSFSRLTQAPTFIDLAEGAIRRRGVRQARAVCAVMDGAHWVQGVLDCPRPDAVRILDVPQGAEHLNALLDALRHAGVSLPADLWERRVHHLTHRGPACLLRLLCKRPPARRERDTIREHLGYLLTRETLMPSPASRQHG